MRWIICLVTALCLAVPVSGQTDAELSTSSNTEALTPGVAKVVEIIRSKPAPPSTVLFYVEVDDQRPDGQAVVRFDVVFRAQGLDRLLTYTAEDKSELLIAVGPDLQSNDQWRRLAIIVEGDNVTVEPGARAGPHEGFPERMNALVDRVFGDHAAAAAAAE